LANGAIKPVRTGYTKRLGLLRQPRTGLVLPVDGLSIFCIRQPGRPLNQPLDFSDIREQLEGTGLILNPLGDNTTDPVETPTLRVGGSGIPPSPPGSSPSSSGGESSDEGSSSSEPSQPSTPPTPMENQNNPARPWLDQDVVVVPGPQHPLPKHPEKWFPKFDPDSKQSAEDHIKKFMLAIRL
jgi:hypothetical protein